MARYVDADELIAKYGKKLMCNEITSEEYYAIKIPLDYAPTADVVPTAFHDKCMQIEIEKRRNMAEVVRCEECRYWENRFDVMVCNLTDGMKGASDYCSYGERRTE